MCEYLNGYLFTTGMFHVLSLSNRSFEYICLNIQKNGEMFGDFTLGGDFWFEARNCPPFSLNPSQKFI